MAFILVRNADMDDDSWIAIKVAASADDIISMPCYNRNSIAVLSKAEHKSKLFGTIEISNCATPDKKEGADIY